MVCYPTSSFTFNSSFRYIQDVQSLNNSRLCDYLHLIYPNELEVKDTDTTDTQKSASFLETNQRKVKNIRYVGIDSFDTDYHEFV
jgi:hypothetical protein